MYHFFPRISFLRAQTVGVFALCLEFVSKQQGVRHSTF